MTSVITPISITEEDCQSGLLKSYKIEWFSDNTAVARVFVEEWYQDWTSCYGLFVNSKYRQQGIGNMIVNYLISIGVKYLSVDKTNKIAIDLYQKHGFSFTGENDGEMLRMKLIKQEES